MKFLKWAKRILLSLLVFFLALLIVGYIYEHVTRYYVKKKIPMQGQLISVGDHQLNIQIKGSGEPLVVFESGLDSGGSLVWRAIQDSISRLTTTAAYNRAGILWSERGRGPKTGEAMATELYTLLKKANQNGPYILVGHSMAGYMIRCFVGKYPKEVAGVVLVDVSHPDQFNRFPKELERGTGPSEWLVKLASSIGVTRLFYKWNYANTLPADSINIIHNAYDPHSLPAMMEESRNFRAMADEAGKINSFGNIPLIVITGTSESRSSWMSDKNLAKKSDQIWMQLQNELMQLSTNSEHMYAPKAGHYVQLEQPGVVVEAIRKILGKTKEKTAIASQVN